MKQKNDSNHTTVIEDMEFEKFLKKLGETIRDMRKNASLTQEDMAQDREDYTGIDIKYYQRIEAGKANITLKMLFKICKRLEIEPEDLLR